MANSFTNSISKLSSGCHASIANGIIDSIKYVESIGGNALQIFMGSKLQSSLKYKHKFKDQNEIETLKSAAIGNAQLLTEPSGDVIIISTGKLVNAQIVLVEDNFHSELATGKYLLSNCAQGKSFEETY